MGSRSILIPTSTGRSAGGATRHHHHHGERQRHGPRRRLTEQRAEPPAGASPNIVARMPAEAHRHRPAGRPGAPGAEARHQMPSTSSGQNDEAAMANAQPTSRLMSNGSTASPSSSATTRRSRRRGGTRPRWSTRARPATAPRPPAPADRGGGQERGEGARGHQGAEQLAGEAGHDPLGQHQHDRVGPPGEQQVGRVEPAEHPVERREDVERPEQGEHDHRGLPGGPTVGVRVEAHEDVGQPHRPQERGQDQAVGEVQRVAPRRR